MPEFATSVEHNLSVADATQKLTSFLDHIKEDYGDQVSRLEGSWDGAVLTFSLTTFGLDLEGKLTVEEGLAAVKGTLPFMALAFRGRIEESIKENLKKALEAE